MQTLIATAIISTSMLTADTAAQDDAAPADETVANLAAQICPADTELQWLNIPWRVSFWQGVRDSQIDGKPILLWAMNGHPLGCT